MNLYLQAMDKKTEYSVDVLKALQMIHQAWDAVMQSTIVNCFRKAGFVARDPPTTTDEDFEEEDDLPLSELMARARDAGNTQFSLHDL